MRHLAAVLAMVFLMSLPACADKAKDLYDTAQFEELQSNREHAVQLYEEIVKKYPASEQARKAKERLAALRQPDAGQKQQEKQP